MKTLVEFDRFPLSVCTRNTPLNANEHLIKAKIVEDDMGLVSFFPFVDPKLIYLEQHNSSIGETWNQHNQQFAKYISRYELNNIIDVGGGSGNIYKMFKEIDKDVNWTIIDMNPTLQDEKVNIIKDLFDSKYINEQDVVITSHFLEHVAEIERFLTELASKRPKYHIFSLPNFKEYARSNYSATIMFEHPRYLTEEFLNYILSKTGWHIVDKTYFKNHSIFFTTIPTEPVDMEIKLECSQDIVNFISYLQNKADSLRDKSFYIFGAHFTYYYLLNMGIREEQIIAVVDNDVSKQGKRMYGTNTKVISANQLPVGADLLVEMGPYNDEIKNKIKNVNFL